MALDKRRSLVDPLPGPIYDGAVLAILTLAALVFCYEVEVFPTDSKPHTLELDELLLVSTLFCGGLFICAVRRLAELRRGASRIACAGRPSKNAEIEAAIDALTAEGVDLSKLPRKDAYARICQMAAKLGANIEVGFSAPVIQRVLVRRYGRRA
jgi:hypothetical protein